MSDTDQTPAPAAHSTKREPTNPLTIGGAVNSESLLSNEEAVAARLDAEGSIGATTGSIQKGGDNNYGDQQSGGAATQNFRNTCQTYLCCCFYNAGICSPEMRATACINISAAYASCCSCCPSREDAGNAAEKCGEVACCPFKAAYTCVEKTIEGIGKCCSICL